MKEKTTHILLLFSFIIASANVWAQGSLTQSDLSRLSAHVKFLESQDVLENTGIAMQHSAQRKRAYRVLEITDPEIPAKKATALSEYIRLLEKRDALHGYQDQEILRISKYTKQLEETKIPQMLASKDSESKSFAERSLAHQKNAALTSRDSALKYSDQDVTRLSYYIAVLEKFVPEPEKVEEVIVAAEPEKVVEAIVAVEPVKEPAPISTPVPAPVPEPFKEASLRFYFDHNIYSLDKEAKMKIDTLLNAYKNDKSVMFELEGHTDKTGSDAYNLMLSKRRAEATSNYLKLKGISSQQIKVRHFGKSQPIDLSETKEGSRLNRNVFIKVTKRNTQ